MSLQTRGAFGGLSEAKRLEAHRELMRTPAYSAQHRFTGGSLLTRTKMDGGLKERTNVIVLPERRLIPTTSYQKKREGLLERPERRINLALRGVPEEPNLFSSVITSNSTLFEAQQFQSYQ